MGHKYKGRKKKKKARQKPIDAEKNRRYHQRRQKERALAEVKLAAKDRQLYVNSKDTPMIDIVSPFVIGMVLIALGFAFFVAVPLRFLTMKTGRIEDISFGLALNFISLSFLYGGAMMLLNRKHPLLPKFFWGLGVIYCLALAFALPVNAHFVKEFNPELAGLVGALSLGYGAACASTFLQRPQGPKFNPSD